MASLGVVRVWHRDDGWGVIDSVDTPGGCWAHFSTIAMDGYRELLAGHDIEFTFEEGQQDGYGYRTITVWPK